MSNDTLVKKWKELSGEIKKQWNKLTDNDLNDIAGQKDKFVDALQQKYGYAKDKAESEINKFLNEDEIDWTDLKENAARVVQNFPQEFGQFIQSNPCKAVLVALGTGFLLGSLVMR